MAKKNIENTQNENMESDPAATKPVKTGRKVFKDSVAPAVNIDTDYSDPTVPVKASPKTRKSAEKSQESLNETPESLKEVQDFFAEKNPVKVRRAKWVWLGILIMLVITAIGAGIGYYSAVQVRIASATSQKLEVATTQFVMAEQDLANGNLNMASQRLQYIMTIYPAYPGLDDKLKEVLTAIALSNPDSLIAQSTPVAGFTPVATKDTTAVSVLFPQAQAQLAANDWQGLLDTVNKMRYIDPSYQALKVDGFYYYALINNGISKIQSGNLEVGLYYFAMASKIAPLYDETISWSNFAKNYLVAGSWYGIDFYKSAELFRTVAQDVPNMLDISGLSAKQRYVGSLVGIGDLLATSYDFCNAAIQYTAAKDILTTDDLLIKLQQAEEYCLNPPATPSPTFDPNSGPTPTPVPNSYNPNEG